MTMWRPDTCDCRLLVAGDWASAQVVEKCAVHANVADADLFSQVYHKENKAKNQLLAQAQALKGDTPVQAELSNEIACKFCGPYGVDGTLTFDKDRKIVLTLNDAAVDKVALQDWINKNSGEAVIALG